MKYCYICNSKELCGTKATMDNQEGAIWFDMFRSDEITDVSALHSFSLCNTRVMEILLESRGW